MKKLLLLTFTLFSISAFAQDQPNEKKGLDIWANFGAGKWTTAKNSNLLNFDIGLNAVYAQKHYFSFQRTKGFSSGFLFRPNEIYRQQVYYVNYGQREKIRNWFYFTPSVGIGMANSSITGFTEENTTPETSFLADLLFSATEKTTYTHYTEKSLCIPVNMEFEIAGRFSGLGFGANIIFMKNPSFGFTANLLLGKIHGKK